MVTKVGILRKPITDEHFQNKVYYRLFYVRYADDYLIAVRGPKWLAKDIYMKTQNFLKLNLRFLLKGSDFVYLPNSYVGFLGFDLKISKRSKRSIVETREILSFKKMRNRLTNQKKVMEKRYKKSLLKIYKSQICKMLKILLRNAASKDEKWKALKETAQKDVLNLIETQFSLQNDFFTEHYRFFLNKELFQLKSSWITEKELRALGFDKVIEARENLLKTLELAIGKNSLQSFCKEKVKRIKANSEFKQMYVDCTMYGQPLSLNLRIYAPIKELKNKLKI